MQQVAGKLLVKVRPFQLIPLQQVADGLQAIATERLRKLQTALDKQLQRMLADAQGPLVLLSEQALLRKADAPKNNASGQPRAKAGEGQQRAYQRPPGGVKTPGKHGGKFYYTKTGHIRYGTQPHPSDERDATPEEIRQHYQQFRPSPFAAKSKEHENLLQAIRDLGTGGFTENDWDLLGWWDENQKQFLKMWGLKPEDIQGNLSALELEKKDGTKVSYEQAVHDFFMAHEWEDDETGEAKDAEVEQALKDVMGRYQKALTDSAVLKKAEIIAAQVDEKVYSWFNDMQATSDHYDGLAAAVSGHDPDAAMSNMTIALGAMELVFKPSKATGAKRKSDYLKGSIAPNSGWLEDETGYLSTTGQDRLEGLNVGQLLAVYAGSQLNAMWDPDTATYTARYHRGNLPELAKRARDLAARKLGQDPHGVAMAAVLDGVNATVDRCAETFSSANTGHDTSGVAKRMLDMQSDKLVGGGDTVQQLMEKAAKFEEMKAAALKAREDESWDVPDSMKAGAVGGSKINPRTGEPFGLFPHQKQAINWAKTVKRGLLADDAGMGKTLQVIGLSESLKQEGKIKRTILCLPPSLLAQWQKEIIAFAPDMAKGGRILNLSGLSMAARKAALDSDMAKNAEYVLLSTGSLSYGKGEGDEGEEGMDDSLVEALAQLDGLLFIDEVHQGGFKTGGTGSGKEYKPGTVRHEIAKRIIGERDYAFGGSATPMPNDPMDLFHLTNLFHPHSVGEAEEWENKLSGVKYNKDSRRWEVANPENLAEINRRVKPFVLHRLITDPEVEKGMGTKREVDKDGKKEIVTSKVLPKLTSNAVDLEPSTQKCPVTGWSQLDYLRPGGVCDAIAAKKLEMIKAKRIKDGKEPFDEKVEQSTLFMLEMGLKRQAAISPALVDSRYTGPAAKIDRVIEDTIAHFSGGQGQQGRPIVLFDSFPKKSFPLLKRKLAEAGIDPSGVGEISGGNSSQERAFMQDMLNGYERTDSTSGKKEFVPGKLKVLLVGVKAGGAGLNLQKAANRSMFLSEPWDPATKRQALGRVWRTGQENECSADTYRMVGTFDMRVENKLGTKQLMTTALLGDPNVDFNQGAEEHIQRLTGRALGAENISTEQMAALLQSAGSFSIDADSLGEEFDDVSEDTLHEPHVQKKLQREEPVVDLEQRDKLSKKAPKLAEFVDMSAESDKWQDEVARQTAKQRYDVMLMQAKVAEQAGAKQDAEKAQRAAEKIKAAFPEAFGHVEKRQQDVDIDSLFAQRKQAKVEAAQKQAAQLNEGRDLHDGEMTSEAAQYVLGPAGRDHFDKKTLAAARTAQAAHTKRAQEESKKRADAAKAQRLAAKEKERTAKVKAAANPAPRVEKKAAKPEKAKPPKAAATKPSKAAAGGTKIADKNPFHKKDDALAWGAHEYLRKKKPKDKAETAQYLHDYFKQTLRGSAAAIAGTAKDAHAYLRKHKAVIHA